MNTLRSIRHVAVREDVVESTLQFIRTFGMQGAEALVLWLGNVDAEAAWVTNAFMPKQHPISNENGVGYFVDGDALFQLNRHLAESGLRLIAQVHSHPQEAFHSPADDRYAIVTVDGGLSFVVPDFGRGGSNMAKWAVYRLDGRQWRPLSRTELQQLIEIVGK